MVYGIKSGLGSLCPRNPWPDKTETNKQTDDRVTIITASVYFHDSSNEKKAAVDNPGDRNPPRGSRGVAVRPGSTAAGLRSWPAED